MTSDLPPTGGQQPPSEPFAPPAGPSAATGSPRRTLDEFFNRVRSLGVIRPDEGRWGAGVAAGLSRRWDIDPVLIRGAFVALSIVGGFGVVAYGLCWLLLPQQDGRIHLQEATHGHFSAGFVGAALLSLTAFGSRGGPGPWRDVVWLNWGLPFGLVLTAAVIAGIWWLARDHNTVAGPPSPANPTSPPTTAGNVFSGSTGYATPPGYGTSSAYGTPAYGTPAYGSGQPPSATVTSGGSPGWPGQQAPGTAAPGQRPRDLARELSAPSRTISRLTLGVALLTAAAILVVGHLADWTAPVGLVAAAAALAVIGVGVIVSGFNGRRAAGLVGIGFFLAIGTLAGTGAHEVGIRAGQNLAIVGSQEWRPATADAANTQFNLGVGEATLWLTNPAILTDATPANPLRISARIGAGHLVIIVPNDVAAHLKIQIGAGEVVNPQGKSTQVDGNKGGAGQIENLNTGPVGRPRIIVQIQQGVGQLEIKTAAPAPVGSVPAPTAASSTATPTVSPLPTATS